MDWLVKMSQSSKGKFIIVLKKGGGEMAVTKQKDR